MKPGATSLRRPILAMAAVLAVAAGLVALAALGGPGPEPDPGPVPEGPAPLPAPDPGPAIPESATASAPGAAVDLGVVYTEVLLWKLDGAAGPSTANAAAGVVGEGRTAVLVGRAYDERGGLAGVEVRFAAGLNEGVRAVTNSDGLYEIPGLHPGASLLEVDAPRHGRARRDLVLLRDSVTTLDLPFLAIGNVHGTLLDESGAPIVGAWAEIDGQRQPTDPDGAFFLSGVVPGDLVLYLGAEGFETRRENLHLRPAQHLEFDRNRFVLRRSEPLTLVFDPPPFGGSPAVAILLPDGPPEGRTFPFERLGATWSLPGDASLVIHGIPNGVPFQIRAATGTGGSDPAMRPVIQRPGDTTFTRAAFLFTWKKPVSGTILARGIPVQGARVRVESSDIGRSMERILREYGGLDRFPVPILPWVRRTATTGPTGQFRLETTDMPRPLGLVVEADGYEPAILAVPADAGDLGSIVLAPAPPSTDATVSIRFDGLAARRVRLTRVGEPAVEFEVAAGEPLDLPALEPGDYGVRVREAGRIVLDAAALRVRGNVELRVGAP